MTLTDDSVAASADDPDAGERRRIAPWVALGVGLAVVGLLMLFVAADPDAPAATPDSPLIGKLAPAAVGELGDGTPFDLSRRKGSFVVLNFFQSDCVPCIQEHPELIDFVDQQEQLGSNGAEFYSVVTGDTKNRVERFFDERGGDWPVVYSPGDRISAAFGVALVPETWIIDPNGVVQARFINKVTAEELNVVLQQLREGR